MNNPESEPRVLTELYNADENEWDEIWPSIERLEDECFPGKGLGEKYLKYVFGDKNNIVVLVRRGRKIIGFTCGIPDTNVADAIYIDTTEITPSEQGQKHVVRLMELLEDEARRRNYKFLTRDAEVLNGYADKIVKNYGDRIIESHDHESEHSMGGVQRFFKIIL